MESEQERLRLIHSMDQVFNNEMLREIIIGHVISAEIAEGSSRNDLRSIRLVQKSWLEDACKYFIKVGKPLFHIQLTKENSLNESRSVQQTGQKLLDRFTIAILSRLVGTVPPFHLSISADFFQEENHASFSRFLSSSCTAGLIQLEVSIPKKGGSMTYIFRNANLHFPILKELVFKFTKEHSPADVFIGSNFSNAVYLVQFILNGTTNLKNLRFSTTTTSTVPDQVEYLVVPPTITNLKMPRILSSSQLKFLMTNQLPILTTLEICGVYIPYHPTRFLFKILDKFRTTLCRLSITRPYSQNEHQRNFVFFKFPLMEKLKFCHLYSMNAELEPQLGPLENMLPELSTLTIMYQTVGMFEKWTLNSKFPAITRLSASLVNENELFDSREFYLTFNLEMMQLLHIAFPNVSSLSLGVTGMETDGLKYLFLEMTQLKHLTISVKDGMQYVNSDHWDALLVGVPEELAATLRTNIGFWPYITLKDEDECIPSIKRLTQLKSLSLNAFYRSSDSNAMETAGSLISDVLFQFALLKMSNLKTLKFGGRFKASPEMVHAWRSDKYRIFDYMAAR